MLMKRWPIWFGIVAGLFLGWFVLWPIIDQELMKAPFTDGVAAFRKKDFSAVGHSFTPDAVVEAGGQELQVHRLLNVLQMFMTKEDTRSASGVKFGGLTNIERKGKTAEVDFTLVFVINDDNIPYRNVPVRKKAHATLVRDGWFSWKISRVSSEELDAELEIIGQ